MLTIIFMSVCIAQVTVSEESQRIAEVEQKVEAIVDKLDSKIEKMDEQLKAADDLINRLRLEIKAIETAETADTNAPCATELGTDEYDECVKRLESDPEIDTKDTSSAG